MRGKYKIVRNFLPGIFILLLVFPKIQDYITVIPETRNTENRKMATNPEFDFENRDVYPSQYADYFEDNFSLRNQLLLVNNLYNYFILDKSIAEKKVVIGKNGWLFKNNNAFPKNAINDAYSDIEARELVQEFEERTNYYKSLGAKYYVFIVPNKATIYPEYVKDRYNIVDSIEIRNRMDRFMSYLNNHSEIDNVYYLKDYLLSKKDLHQLFYKKDHHWNNIGALYATDFINHVISNDFNKIKNTSKIENYTIEVKQEHLGNLAHTLGIQYALFEDVYYLHPNEGVELWEKGLDRKYKPTKGFAYPWEYQKSTIVKNDSLPKALIIRDSFTNALIPFLSNDFRDALYIWDAWHYGWNKEIFENEKPDIVINIMVEEHLYHMVKFSDLHND
jgi:alginate O-acetyltransferase complex protein AlgJ